MRKFFVGLTLAAALAAPAGAQESVVMSGKPSVFHVTPYVGYVFFGDYLELPDGSEYTNDNTGIFGIEAGLDVSRAVSIVANFGYMKTNFEFENVGTTQDQRASGDIGIFAYDASLRLKVPMIMGMTSFAPYLQAGIGQFRYTPTFDNDDFNADGSVSNMAYNVGAGATFKFAGVGLRGEVKDYITSLDWQKVSDANDLGDFESDKIAHNWAVSLGLTIGF